MKESEKRYYLWDGKVQESKTPSVRRGGISLLTFKEKRLAEHHLSFLHLCAKISLHDFYCQLRQMGFPSAEYKYQGMTFVAERTENGYSITIKEKHT